MEFIACKPTGQQHTDPQQPGTAELPSQGSRFCCSLSSQKEKGGSAKWTYTHKHTEESRLKPQHKENKNSRDQRARDLHGKGNKGTGLILGATGATLEVGEWKEVLHKVRHGTYITEEHSDGAQGAQDTRWPGDRPHGLDKTRHDSLLPDESYPIPPPAVQRKEQGHCPHSLCSVTHSIQLPLCSKAPAITVPALTSIPTEALCPTLG